MDVTTKESLVIYFSIFLAILILLGFYFWFLFSSGEINLSDTTPGLFGDCLFFPDGWQPIAGEVHDGVYLCQSLVTNEYRQCIPQYVACEGE